jgi:hypothetical protein
MIVHTDYLFFNTKQRQEFVRITDDVARIVEASAVQEGMVLVSAMHITGRCGCRLPVAGCSCEPRETTLTRLFSNSRPGVVRAGSGRQPATNNQQPIMGVA